MAKNQTPIFVRNATGLVREISALDAMMVNLVGIGVLFALVNNIFAAELYPGADLIYTALIALLFCLPYASLYILFSASMPRSGGDYVWVSRTLNPPLGFFANFYLTLIILSFSGITTGWGFQYALAPLFQGLYQMSGNPQYSSLVAFFSNTTYDFLSSAIVSVISGILIILGTRKLITFQWVAGIASIIGAITFIVVLFSVNPSTVTSNFNRYAPVTMNNVTSTAAANGISTGFTAGGTLFGSVFATLTLIAFMYSAYFSGEVKGLMRSQVIAQYGSLIFAAILQILIVASLYHAFGSAFISALSQLALTSHYPLPLFPSSEYLFSFVTTNFVLIGIVNVAFMLMCWGACATYIFTSSRNIFSWSFDRVFPARMSNVSSRFGTPYIIVIFATIISVIYAVLNYYTTILSTVLSYSILGWWIGVIIVAIAGIVFPFRKRGVFESSPGAVKYKIGSIPLMTILGVMLAIIAAFIAYAVISPSYIGVLNPSYVFAVIALLILGVVIYYAAYVYHKRHGIPFEAAQREIPPE
jgi:amino acid transporter